MRPRRPRSIVFKSWPRNKKKRSGAWRRSKRLSRRGSDRKLRRLRERDAWTRRRLSWRDRGSLLRRKGLDMKRTRGGDMKRKSRESTKRQKLSAYARSRKMRSSGLRLRLKLRDRG